MLKRKSSPLQTSSAKRTVAGPKLIPKGKDGTVRILRVKKGDSLKTIYAKARLAFTAADLQKYTEIEEMIPWAQIMSEFEAIQREEMKKIRKKSKR